VEILMRSTRIRDERVLGAVVTALGRVGDRSALAEIERVKRMAGDRVGRQADFAAALIAHRLGLDGHDAVHHADYLTLDAAAARPFRVERPDVAEAELCLRSVAIYPCRRRYRASGVGPRILVCTLRQVLPIGGHTRKARVQIPTGLRERLDGDIHG
jgi:hypothetical protein